MAGQADINTPFGYPNIPGCPGHASERKVLQVFVISGCDGCRQAREEAAGLAGRGLPVEIRDVRERDGLASLAWLSHDYPNLDILAGPFPIVRLRCGPVVRTWIGRMPEEGELRGADDRFASCLACGKAGERCGRECLM